MRAGSLIVFLLVLAACGRTGTYDGVAPAHLDSGALTFDAGPAISDGGAPDGGYRFSCVPRSDLGFITGQTPLGFIDFRWIWVGTESPGSHSCPHFTVNGSSHPEASWPELISIDFNGRQLDHADWTMVNLRIGGQSVTGTVLGKATRADGITRGTTPRDTWRTSVTFTAADGGWDLHGEVTDAPDCIQATWFCL